jgi:ATP-dependent Lhr-like helicase
VLLAPDEVEPVITAEIGGSALFAARFRECAARALLLPRRDPTRRTPLWQQRQRSAQLLSVASEYASFPIVLETVRECLQDVFDVPALVELMREIEGRRVRLVEVTTAHPSPYARSLLFGYVASFMYEGDAPLAERRAQALALDATLLAELLGHAELRELLDGDIVDLTELELQRLDGGPARVRRRGRGRPAADPRAAVDGRGAGPRRHGHGPRALEEQRRVIRVRLAGEERWAAIEDAGRLRTRSGCRCPSACRGVPRAGQGPGRRPARAACPHPRARSRRRPPRRASAWASPWWPGPWAGSPPSGRVVEGEFRPGGGGHRVVRRRGAAQAAPRSLAALRKEVGAGQPQSPRALPAGVAGHRRQAAAVFEACSARSSTAGRAGPGLGSRATRAAAACRGYSPALLDELTRAGEVLWAGAGSLQGDDGWVALALADTASLLLPPPEAEVATPLHEAVDRVARGRRGAVLPRALGPGRRLGGAHGRQGPRVGALGPRVGRPRHQRHARAPAHPARQRSRGAPPGAAGGCREGRYGGTGRAPMPSRTGPATTVGRWSLLPPRDNDPTRRAHAYAETLLDRHGVVTRGAVMSERPPGGFAAAYRVLAAFEETGRCRRGYFVEGLGAAQFASPGAVDRMRAMAAAIERRDSGAEAQAWQTITPTGWQPARQPVVDGPAALVLASTDPANPYGAALPWPPRPGENAAGHKPGRKAGALVVLVDGELVLYVERGGRTLLTWVTDTDEGVDARLQPAVDALALAVRDGALGRMTVQKADGEAVLSLRPRPGPGERRLLRHSARPATARLTNRRRHRDGGRYSTVTLLARLRGRSMSRPRATATW